jgi:hypothetical protein
VEILCHVQNDGLLISEEGRVLVFYGSFLIKALKIAFNSKVF